MQENREITIWMPVRAVVLHCTAACTGTLSEITHLRKDREQKLRIASRSHKVRLQVQEEDALCMQQFA